MNGIGVGIIWTLLEYEVQLFCDYGQYYEIWENIRDISNSLWNGIYGSTNQCIIACKQALI